MSSFDDVQRVNLDEEERLDPQSWYEIICRNPLGTHALLPHDIYSVLLEVARDWENCFFHPPERECDCEVCDLAALLASLGPLPEAE